MDDLEGLRQAVEAQAQAHVAGDIATFASYMTPQALLRLHRQGETLRAGSGIRRYEVLDVLVRGNAGSSDVRYDGSRGYLLRTQWERPGGLWKAVVVQMPLESISGPWWRRVLRLGRSGARGPVAERRDLR